MARAKKENDEEQDMVTSKISSTLSRQVTKTKIQVLPKHKSVFTPLNATAKKIKFASSTKDLSNAKHWQTMDANSANHSKEYYNELKKYNKILYERKQKEEKVS